MQLLKEGGRVGDFSPEVDMCCNLRICVYSCFKYCNCGASREFQWQLAHETPRERLQCAICERD